MGNDNLELIEDLQSNITYLNNDLSEAEKEIAFLTDEIDDLGDRLEAAKSILLDIQHFSENQRDSIKDLLELIS